MSTETRHGLDAIEHLDFAPACQSKNFGCCGANLATYLARFLCCGWAGCICSACVALAVGKGAVTWKCKHCPARVGPCGYLDVVTLHPLGGAS